MGKYTIQISAGTNIGLIRSNNEDNFVVNPDLSKSEWIIPETAEPFDLGEYGCLLAVADGMGGANAGEVASAIAMDTVQEMFAVENLAGKTKSEETICNFMTSVVKTADLNIAEHCKNDSSTRGMGTTIVLAWLLDKKAYICWCGDSRCYVFNQASGLCRLSKDHSYVQQLIDDGKLAPENAMHHPYSNVITRCLGDQQSRALPDFRTYEIKNGDCFLLCSDGLHGLCPDDDIINTLNENIENLTELKEQLIQNALAAGGDDNVTIALCRVTTDSTSEEEEKKEDDLGATINTKHKAKGNLVKLLLAVAAIAIIAAALYFFLHK